MKSLIIVLIIILTTNCVSNDLKSSFHITTPLKKIYEEPTSIGSDSIYITGKVIESYGSKGLSGYIIEADGYSIWIWTKEDTAPSVNSTIKTKGVVKIIGNSYFFFDKSFR